MPGGRAYDYSAPFFGGFTCMPPAMNTTRSDRADAFASTRADSLRRSEFASSSSRQSSFSRSDSLKSNPRQDSLTRPPLTRMDTLSRTSTSTSDYSSGSSARPTSSNYSSSTYTSPYTNNYRSTSKY